MRRLTLSLALVVLLARCAPVPQGPFEQAYLFEKGEYQAVYRPDGRILRLLQDRDGDQRAEVSITYDPDGKRRAELDTDRDGVVDRWELYDARERLTSVGQSRRGGGHADLWELLDVQGGVRERQIDDDGDGRLERHEHFAAGQGLQSVELDTDADGRVDRWQRWEARRLVGEDLDIDGDGRADRRFTYEPSGAMAMVKLRP